MSEQSISTGETERVVGLDVLRGFALFGVLLTNASVSARPLLEMLEPPLGRSAETASAASGPMDMAAWAIFDGLLVTKFVTLFSLLFGMGLVLQNQRAEAKGLPFTKLYRRRLGILAVMGLLHGCFLFEGDILLVYAIVGSLLFFFRNQPARVLLRLSMIPFFFGVMLTLLWAVVDWESLIPAAEPNSTFAESPRPNSLIDVFWIRPIEYLGWLAISTLISFNWRVVSFFFLGAAIMKGNWILPSHLGIQRKVAMIGLSIGLILELLSIFLTTLEQPAIAARTGIALCDEFGSVALSFGYAASVLSIVNAGRLPWLAGGLAAVGRTALTNYLLQSVAMNIVFMEFLLGCYQELSRMEVLVWFTGIFVLQIVASQLWLRFFKSGPIEWLWRWFTYRGISSPVK